MNHQVYASLAVLALASLACGRLAGEPPGKGDDPVAKKNDEKTTGYRITFEAEALKDPTADAVITHSTTRGGQKLADVGLIRIKGLNRLGQATGAEATVTRTCLVNSSRHGPNGRYDPPGWQYDQGLTRLMLFPYRMGGYGYYPQNLVTVYRDTVVPRYNAVIDRLHDAAVKEGKTVKFTVTPIYRDAGKPTAIVIRANVPLEGGKKEVTIANEPPKGKPAVPREKGLLPEVVRLKRLMPPPKRPTAAGSAKEWAAVEKRLGLTFPEDYKQFIRLYGDGEISDFFRIANPFSPRDWNNYEEVMSSGLDAYRDLRRQSPADYPYEAWPRPGGLLPLGSTSNGDTLYWRTAGKPDAWTVVVHDRGGAGFFECPSNLTTFLRRVFEEEFQAAFLAPPFIRPVFEPYMDAK